MHGLKPFVRSESAMLEAVTSEPEGGLGASKWSFPCDICIKCIADVLSKVSLPVQGCPVVQSAFALSPLHAEG